MKHTQETSEKPHGASHASADCDKPDSGTLGQQIKTDRSGGDDDEVPGNLVGLQIMEVIVFAVICLLSDTDPLIWLTALALLLPVMLIPGRNGIRPLLFSLIWGWVVVVVISDSCGPATALFALVPSLFAGYFANRE